MDKKLITLVVSGAITGSQLLQADGSGPTIYGRVNLAIEVNDSGEDTVTDLRDVVSRFGVKGKEDLGNGLAAVYHYEFRVNADRGNLNSAANGTAQRLSYAGIKGGFGQINLGTVSGTWINTVGTYLDPTYTLGYFGYSTYAGGDYRIESVIQYSGNFGPLTIGADVQVDNSNAADDNIDRWIVGAQYSIGPVSFGVAYDEEKLAGEDAGGNEVEGDDKHRRIGAMFNYVGDSFYVNLGWINSDNEQDDTDRDYWTINGAYDINDKNQIYLQYWDGEGDSDDIDGDGVVLAYFYKLSNRSIVYFEGHTGETGDVDNDVYLFGLRHDF